jgi:Carboxypeptidase regulatory-like domain
MNRYKLPDSELHNAPYRNNYFNLDKIRSRSGIRRMNPKQPVNHLKKIMGTVGRLARPHSSEVGWMSNLRNRFVFGTGDLIRLGLYWSLCGFALLSAAQAQQPSATPQTPNTGAATNTAADQAADSQAAGTISGTVEDQSGAVSVGARVRLTGDGQSAVQEVLSGANGEFSFAQITPGRFHLTVTSAGFVTQEVSGVLQPGGFYLAPLITLEVSGGATEVRVGGSQVEVAEEQIKIEEKQRVLGIIPNFYVTYEPDAAPLNVRQKFQLAWKSATDPVTIVGAGFLAGLQQASDDYSGYGQGMQGYAKRLGAAYTGVFAGTLIGSAILPSLLKQDPRYFYKGTGSTRSRIGYAVANSVICKGDNKRWQPNYSIIVGSFATGGLSYLYYPKSDRSAGLLVQNSLLKIAGSSLAGIFQEFVVRRLTPAHDRAAR